MKYNRKLKSFESYIGAGDDVNEPVKFTDEEAKARIKTIIEGIIESKQYFQMLKDSTENVFSMIYNILPENTHTFANELYKRNDFLADLVDDLMITLGGSSMYDDLDEIINNLQKIEDLTEDNWDDVLSGENGQKFNEDEDDDDEFIDEEEELDEKDENSSVSEGIKKMKDLEKIVKKYAVETLKKGDIVYIKGIRVAAGKQLNGKKAIIIKKDTDKEDCYDLFVPSLPHIEKNTTNVSGMPAKFLQKEKIDEKISFRNQKYFEGIDFYKGEKHKVRIIKCDNPELWYKKFINKDFTVVEDDSRTNWKDGKEKWKVVPENGIRGVNYINKEDTKIIE